MPVNRIGPGWSGCRWRSDENRIFWVPPEARWTHLKAQARQSTIGQLVDGAMAGIERDNPALKGVLSKDYARHHARQAAARPDYRPHQ